jgi:hypothetical protein
MGRIGSWREAVDGLLVDLRAVLDTRLRSLVVYEAHGMLGDTPATGEGELQHGELVHTLVVVDDLRQADLERLAPLSKAWSKRGLAVPLVLEAGEVRRSLDAFPLEFSQMIARHLVVAGEDPFAGLEVADEDLRRACETQARSHLLHLRQGFIETDGDPSALARLVADSATPLRALLVNIARLHGVNARTPDALLHFASARLHLPADSLRPVLAHQKFERFHDIDVAAFFPGHLQAVERLVALVDEWTR